jgi:SagB-type dehydrogenase family enzyme
MPISRQDLLCESERDLGLPLPLASLLLDQLLAAGLLCSELTPLSKRWVDLTASWSKFGWEESARYFLSTFDSEFAQGDDEGRHEAALRMRRYSSEEPDTLRFKQFANAKWSKPLPQPTSIVLAKELSSTLIEQVVSIAFAQTCAVPIAWSAIPLEARTSPSGGCRHPTEGYLYVLDLPGLPKGCYHINSKGPSLDLLFDEPESLAGLDRGLVALVGRVPFTPRAIVIFSTVFEKNMYRYREDRTFRTVHMDVGHLIATIECVAREAGQQTFVQYSLDDGAIEQAIGLNFLVEGIQGALAIG